MDDLKWFLGIMAVLFIAWFVSGGPDRVSSHKGPLIKPPEPVSTGEIYGPTNWFGVRAPIIVTVPTGWQQANTQYFVFYMPKGWSWYEVENDNPYRGIITNGRTTLSFEYGQDTNPLTLRGDVEYAITEEKVGTYNATFITPKGGTTGTTGAYYEKSFKKYTLTITGENLTSKEKEEVFKLFRSVRFKVIK